MSFRTTVLSATRAWQWLPWRDSFAAISKTATPRARRQCSIRNTVVRVWAVPERLNRGVQPRVQRGASLLEYLHMRVFRRPNLGTRRFQPGRGRGG